MNNITIPEQILDKRISLSRLRPEKIRVWKRRHRKDNAIVERPVGIGYLTIRELLFVLTSIQKDYLMDSHYFGFRGEKILVRIIDSEEDENKPKDLPADATV